MIHFDIPDFYLRPPGGSKADLIRRRFSRRARLKRWMAGHFRRRRPQ